MVVRIRVGVGHNAVKSGCNKVAQVVAEQKKIAT